MKKIILASGSPRRSELLTLVGIPFEVCVSKTSETTSRTKPEEVVKELSYSKAKAVYNDGHEDDVVIGADTVVYLDETILGKPADKKQCKAMLKSLSGRSHKVYTGVTVLWREPSGGMHVLSFCQETKVRIFPLTDEEIEEYIATGEPLDKAGAYGIQGIFAKHIESIEGDYYNVVGLPVARLYRELKGHKML
ncbi:MAG: Maf family protein [Lachnospiraceae bacterium]|nr:Maf family protein [Lachnospiraceae bacterium]